MNHISASGQRRLLPHPHSPSGGGSIPSYYCRKVRTTPSARQSRHCHGSPPIYQASSLLPPRPHRPVHSARFVRHCSDGFERATSHCRLKSCKQLKGHRLVWPVFAGPVPGWLRSWLRLPSAAKRGYGCHSRLWGTTEQQPAAEAAEGLKTAAQAGQ
jgi:hypothetical protein